MLTTPQIAASKAIQRRTGRTFHLATRFLPKRVRHATYVLYGFFRIADEVVDDPGNASAADQRARLAALRDAALGDAPATDPVVEAFAELRVAHGVPREEVTAFVDAMARDVETSHYERYEDLEAYMRGSAVAVANMMTAVMAPPEATRAAPHAAALAEAFQLTNFLRDVREDVLDRDRVYLPVETLRAHGASLEEVRALDPTSGVRAAVREELAWAERRYRAGVAGIEYLPEDCRFPVLLAAVLYVEHHRLIRARGYDVLTERPTLSARDKLRAVARTYVAWKRTRDPVAVFDAASHLRRVRHPHGLVASDAVSP